MCFALVDDLVVLETWDPSVLFPGVLVSGYKSSGLQRLHDLREIKFIVRQNLNFQLGWYPLESSLSVAYRPKTREGDTKRKMG